MLAFSLRAGRHRIERRAACRAVSRAPRVVIEGLESRLFFDAGATLGTAQNLGAIATSGTVSLTESVNGTDTTDVFKFSINSIRDVTASTPPGSGDVHVALIRDSNGNQLIDIGDLLIEPYGFGGSGASAHQRLEAGTYYIQITPNGSGTKAYALKLTAPAANADAGNTLTAARNLGALSTAPLTIADWVGSADPDDFYKFSISSIRDVTASIPPQDSPGDTHIAIIRDANANGQIDSDDNLIGGYTFGGSGTSAHQRLEPGTYYVQVFPNGAKDDVYHLTIVTNNANTDAGNTLATARLAGALGNTAVNLPEWVGSADPEDFFKFTISTTRDVTTSIPPGGVADSHLEIIRDVNGNGHVDNGDVLASTYSFGRNGISLTRNLTAGAYYVHIFPNGASDDPYTLTLYGPGPAPINGSITGSVFNDLDGDGVKDSNESGLSGRTVYIDLDNDSILDAGEKSTTTNAVGAYTLSNLPAGTYKLRTIRPAGWIQTYPLNNYGIAVTLSAGQVASGRNFFTRQTPVSNTGKIQGSVFHDFDRDGLRDIGDIGLAGWTVYLDKDNDGILDSNETRVLTDSSGNYSFNNLAAGSYKIRIVRPTGYVQTTPTNNFGNNATLATSSSVVTGKNFGADN
jgi:uncharacterized protein (DUF2141 family)